MGGKTVSLHMGGKTVLLLWVVKLENVVFKPIQLIGQGNFFRDYPDF